MTQDNNRDQGFYRCYERKNFSPERLALIGQINKIIDAYADDGFSMTVRQIYYQLVTVNAVENTKTSYNNVSSLISDGRMAGLISWEAIEDRLRQLRGDTYFDSPAHVMRSALSSYRLDKWADQPCRVEVLVEKDALSDVVGSICLELGLDYIVCRGYTSMSTLWRAGRRYAGYVQRGQRPIVLYLGDHDPSGLDMTRDNERRISLFAGVPIQVIRLALNMPQVERYQPPPNPAKVTDSRYAGYVERYGDESWELDALSPRVIRDLIRDAVMQFRDEKRWEAMLAQEVDDRRVIEELVEQVGDEE